MKPNAMCQSPEFKPQSAGVEVNCPEPPPFGLLGREAVFLELERLLSSDTIVLLVGETGVGKTETAVGFGRWLNQKTVEPAPIVYFCFDCPKPLAQVCDQVGHLFQDEIRSRFHKEWPLLDAAQRRATVLALLHEAPCLMIWDNLEAVRGQEGEPAQEQTLEERGALRDFLSALRGGRARVLLASCQDEPWLDSVCHRTTLAGLPLEAAQELAQRVLQQAGLSTHQIESLPPCTELFQFLQCNPLVLQIVLPDLRRATPESILQALAEAETAQGPERLLATVLAYRFGSLDPALRRRLGVLGLFQGFVSTRVLAAISAQDGAPELVREWGRDGWMRLLDAVAGLGLLKRAAPGNYLIHTAVQSKLHDLLTEALSENVAWLQRTFCAIYGRVGNQLFQIHQANAELALALLRSEQDNLTCAFRLARRRKDWGAVSDLLCGLRMLLVVHGRWTEWEGLISELETEVISGESEVPSDLETLSFRLVGHRAEICEYRHDHVRLSLLQQGLRERYQIKGGAPRQADVLKDLGAISEQRGQFDEAERFYLKSLAIRQQAGDEAAQASLLLHLGDLAGQQRRWREADRWYRHSLGLWKRLGQADLQATTCCRLAAICQERGELEEAEDWFKQTLAIRAQLGGEPRQAAALHQLGRIAHEQRQYGLAEQRYRQSLQFRQTMGDEPGLAATLHQLGRLARDQKQFAEAESYFHQALAIRERLGDRPGQAQTIHQLGNIAFLEGHYEEAESWYQQSLKIRQALHDAPGQARNLNQLAKIAQARGDATIAEEYLNCVEALADQIQDPISGLSTLIVIGPK